MRDNLNNPFNVMRHRDWDRAPREAIATFLFPGAMAVGGAAAFAALAVTYVGVTLVSSWAINALSPKPSFGAAGERGLLTNTREATAPQDIVYGEIRKGGVITYLESTGDTNKYLHMIISMAGHEINSFESIYINDEVISRDADGFVTDATWCDSDSNSKILIKTFTGAANQNVYSTLSGITDGPEWQGKATGDDTNFRGQGIACLYVRMEFDQDVFANGIPLFTAKIRGKKVYDPRTSTTGYSNNAALCIRDYLVSKYGLDSAGDINETALATAANVSDETVSLSSGGTEARYTINGVISMAQSPGDILADMMTACAGTLFWGQGKWHIKVGDYTSSVKTFTLDDFRGPITLDTKHSRRNNFNVVRGTFINASDDFIRADYPEIRSLTWIAQDADVESAVSLDLPLTTSETMAQRLAKMTLFRSREQMTMTADFSLKALDVEVGDVVAITNARYGMSAKEFEVVGWRFFNDGDAGDQRVGLTLRETSSAAFDWNAEEQDIDSNNPTITTGTSDLTITNLVASGGGRTTSDGTFINSAILSWTVPNDVFVSYFDVEWKATADSNYHATTATQSTIEISPLVDGVQYTIRVRAVTANGRRGPFATVTFTGGGDTTAPGLPTSISATGGFKYIEISWTNPADNDLNYVEVYENTSNSSAGATLVGISAGDNFYRGNLGLSQTRYYFLKSVDYSGNKSAFTTGVSATTTFLDDADFENGVRQLFIDAGLDVIEPVSSLPSSGDFTGQQVFLTTDSKLYYWTGSQWDTVVAAVGAVDFSDLTGQLSDAQIAVNAINGTKITDGTITSNEIAARTILAGNIASGTIGANEIAANAITANEIAANTITASQLAANTITANQIAANTITGGLLATSGIITSAAQINDAVIENAKIKNAAVDTLKVAGNAITFPTSATGSSGIFLNSSSGESTAASLTATASGAPCRVNFSIGITHTQVNQTQTNEGQYVQFEISAYRGSSLVKGYVNAYVGGLNLVYYNLPYIATLYGTFTFYLKVKVTGGDAGYLKYFNPVIDFVELKR